MRLWTTIAATSILSLAAACGANGQGMPQDATTGQPIETRPANDPSQRPAFDGQTRAPSVSSNFTMANTVVASGLSHPWGLAWLPGDDVWLVTERSGGMRTITTDGVKSEPIQGLPPVAALGQGGQLDVVPGPDFASSRLIYFSYSQPREGGNATAVARGRLSADRTRVENVQVIFEAQPTYDGDKHFGSSLAFDQQGHLFITTGDRSDAPMRPQAQDLGSHMGKTIRINADGSVPADNPYVNTPGARPEIWSLGHRNMQGVAVRSNGQVWTIEHGTRGGDELNFDRAGVNYGWPIIAYGVEYRGAPINEGITAREGLEQPVYYWDPVIAPGGLTFYEADLFPGWRGSALIGGLGSQRLVRVVLDGDRVVGEEHLLTGLGERIRDVAVAPDGAIWVITDSEDGKLVRFAPAG